MLRAVLPRRNSRGSPERLAGCNELPTGYSTRMDDHQMASLHEARPETTSHYETESHQRTKATRWVEEGITNTGESQQSSAGERLVRDYWYRIHQSAYML